MFFFLKYSPRASRDSCPQLPSGLPVKHPTRASSACTSIACAGSDATTVLPCSVRPLPPVVSGTTAGAGSISRTWPSITAPFEADGMAAPPASTTGSAAVFAATAAGSVCPSITLPAPASLGTVPAVARASCPSITLPTLVPPGTVSAGARTTCPSITVPLLIPGSAVAGSLVIGAWLACPSAAGSASAAGAASGAMRTWPSTGVPKSVPVSFDGAGSLLSRTVPPLTGDATSASDSMAGADRVTSSGVSRVIWVLFAAGLASSLVAAGAIVSSPAAPLLGVQVTLGGGSLTLVLKPSSG